MRSYGRQFGIVARMDQLIQIAGALLVLLAFTGLQAGWTAADSKSYIVFNLVGSAILATLALLDEQWGFLLLEGVWAVVSAWSLWRAMRGLPVAGAH